MNKAELYKDYRYYKGEKENPFIGKYNGNAFWWTVESYAVEREDKKEAGKLSKTMKEYIVEHHWDGDAQHDTTKELALQRATQMYQMGIWCQSYICIKAFKLEHAIDASNS